MRSTYPDKLRAAQRLLDAAKAGKRISQEAITIALQITGDLPTDDDDLEPPQQIWREAGEWELSFPHCAAPASWLCGLA